MTVATSGTCDHSKYEELGLNIISGHAGDVAKRVACEAAHGAALPTEELERGISAAHLLDDEADAPRQHGLARHSALGHMPFCTIERQVWLWRISIKLSGSARSTIMNFTRAQVRWGLDAVLDEIGAGGGCVVGDDGLVRALGRLEPWVGVGERRG